MFGLIVAELAIKFADAIDSHRERPVGILTPALALLVLTDVTSFWLFIWTAPQRLEGQLAHRLRLRPRRHRLFPCRITCVSAHEPRVDPPRRASRLV